VSWQTGDVVVIQEVWNGRLWSARPVVVVEDRDDELVLWCPEGTVRKVPADPPERLDPSPTRGERIANRLEAGDWVLEDSAWDVSTLWLLRPEDWHAVWVSFKPGAVHWGWYLNFQEPARRTARALQTMDLALDIVVEADGTTWRWKDEDEFDLLLARGLFSCEVGARVRDEAAGLIERLARKEKPFDGDWPSWRPDPAWGLPALPPGWDLL
jgi:predicted RNA-binding protein associated with RNAse of E/G family